MVTVAQTHENLKAIREQRKAARRPLYERCRKLHITHDRIAAEARCSRVYVVMYFSGYRSPRAVELAAEKLIGQVTAAARRNGQRSRHA